MSPEILIVGDAPLRRDLIRQVRDCGYDVTLCRPSELNPRVRMGPSPAAVVVCIQDTEAPVLLAGLRRTRQGAAIPVLLHGRLGGAIQDFADVLDCGADHFLPEPIDPVALREALTELAGPVGSGESIRERRRGYDGDETVVLEEALRKGDKGDKGRVTRPKAGKAKRRDGEGVILQELHRTLDRLDARLGRRSEESEVADRDLLGLGLEDIPNVEPEGATLDVGEERFDFPSKGQNPDDRVQGDEATALVLDDLAADLASVVAGREPLEGAQLGGTERLGLSERGHSTKRERVFEDEASHAKETDLDTGEGRSAHETAGALGEFPRLLWQLHRRAFSGTLTLLRGREEKNIDFERGEVVFVRSHAPRDRLVDGLLRKGVLSREQYDQARRMAAKEPRRLGTLLVEAGFLKASELRMLLREHLQRMLDACFTWTEGEWEIEEGTACEEEIVLELPTAVLILEGIRHRLDEEELWDRLGDTDACLVLKERKNAKKWSERAKDLRLLPEEIALLSRFDGRRSLETIVRESEMEFEALSLAYALQIFEELYEGGGDEEGTGSETFTGELKTRIVDRENPVKIDEERIVERLRLSREGDYFTLLGLSRDATRAEIRAARKELLATFDDERLEALTRERFGDALRELRDSLEEAGALLLDDTLRRAYLAHLEP